MSLLSISEANATVVTAIAMGEPNLDSIHVELNEITVLKFERTFKGSSETVDFYGQEWLDFNGKYYLDINTSTKVTWVNFNDITLYSHSYWVWDNMTSITCTVSEI